MFVILKVLHWFDVTDLDFNDLERSSLGTNNTLFIIAVAVYTVMMWGPEVE